MIKTATGVRSDFYKMVKNSRLAKLVSGVYIEQTQERDFRNCLVVIFTAGDSEEIQTGVVTLNIFCNDLLHNGIWKPDYDKLLKLETAAADFVESLTVANSNYRIKLQQAICTDYDEATHQHFVVVKMKYYYLDK